jgi:hypothetical protein
MASAVETERTSNLKPKHRTKNVAHNVNHKKSESPKAYRNREDQTSLSGRLSLGIETPVPFGYADSGASQLSWT